jgi:quercetin dioxygenase-like cupin family protein
VKLTNIPEGVTDWSHVAMTEVPGASGTARIRMNQIGQIQLRVVEYTPGYLGDHWCSKGHVVYVIRGELTIEHEHDAPSCSLATGMSWYVADDEGIRHRVRSLGGATIFIID